MGIASHGLKMAGEKERKMIKIKADLQRALQAKKPLTFTTIKNAEKPELEGITRKVGTIVQGNAFTLATEKQNGYNINDKKLLIVGYGITKSM